MASRSSANCGKSMCAWESISSIGSMPDSAATVGARYIVPLLQSCADFDVFVGEAGEDRAAFRADGGGYDHAVGFHATKLARREIEHNSDFAADQFFGFVILRDASADLANFSANIHGKLQEFVRANDAFGGFDLTNAHFDFGKVLDADFFICGRRSGGSSAASGGRACVRCRSGGRRLFLWFVFHGFHPLDCFCFFNAREKRLRFSKWRARGKLSPSQAIQCDRRWLTPLAQQRPDLCGAPRQDRMRQRRYDSQHFRGDPENGGTTLLVGITLTERPGMLSGKVFVRRGNQRPNLLQHPRERQVVVQLKDFADRRLNLLGQRHVLRLKRSGLGYLAAATLLNHRRGTASKVTKAVGEIAVVARHDRVIAEIAVLAEVRFTQEV